MTGLWFSTGTPFSPSNKTYDHDITEILLKVALNTITITLLLSSWNLTTSKYTFRSSEVLYKNCDTSVRLMNCNMHSNTPRDTQSLISSISLLSLSNLFLCRFIYAQFIPLFFFHFFLIGILFTFWTFINNNAIW